MIWTVDGTLPRALHEQIAANVRRAIGDTTLAPGERLPPAGELAGVLGVNANTVLHAYRALRDEGLLEFRRGRGVRVAAGSADRAPVLDAVHTLMEIGHRHGYTTVELARLLTDR
jgi:GntR family transcriptional regulator